MDIEYEVAPEINMWVNEYQKSQKLSVQEALKKAMKWIDGKYHGNPYLSPVDKQKAWFLLSF